MSTRKEDTITGRIFDAANVIFLILFAFITFYPFWYVFIISLSNVSLVSVNNIYFIPKLPTLDSYKVVLNDSSLVSGYIVSTWRVVLGVAFCLINNTMIAYVLSRKYFSWRKWLNMAVIITMFVSGGMIPFFLVVHSLHLTNTFWALVIPFGFDPFGILLIKSYFRTIPVSLDESAKLDGANDFLIFFRIYLPMSLPILATMSLYWAVFFWNDFIWGQFLVVKKSLLPIQAVLYRIVFSMSNINILARMKSRNSISGANLESVKSATIILTTLPILLVYPFLQRYFVKGVMLGAVKE